jgi:hypothetical protein
VGSRLIKNIYRRIFILDDRNFWESSRHHYDPERDLILTYDFWLRHHILSLGGEAEYVDHIAESQSLSNFNFEMYRFFSKWHFDEEGKDIFTYKGIDFGCSFQIEIWNDITYTSRLVLNLREIKSLSYEQILIGSKDNRILDILFALSIKWQSPEILKKGNSLPYAFPIFQWNESRLRPSLWGMKSFLRVFLSRLLDGLCWVIDLYLIFHPPREYVLFFPYHPLRPVLAALKKNRRIRIVSEKYIMGRDVLKQRRIPMGPIRKRHEEKALEIIKQFNARKHATWFVEDVNVGSLLFVDILRKGFPQVPGILSRIDSIERYFQNKDLRLMITFSNLGIVNGLTAQYCRKRDIPLYLVINGLLMSSYLDEGKVATSINAYGESIKKEYFKDGAGVVCLGDPRMDDYASKTRRSPIDRKSPTIVIGTAGYRNIDLNSYVAYEFEFLNDVLMACHSVRSADLKLRIVIKVRPNGYFKQYQNFVREYFPDLLIKIVQDEPMMKILEQADLYISTYSQTLFEASCLGIPVIYFANHTEEGLHAPFDGKSGLVTAYNVKDLIEKISAFSACSPIFDDFLDKNLMEKFIGPLDGSATRRNLEFIYTNFLKQASVEERIKSHAIS